MADRGRGRKKTISKAGKTGKEAEVNEHEKRIFRKRISCFGCEAFEDMLPIEKLSTFRSEFDLLHDDRKKAYAKYMMRVEMVASLTLMEELIKDRLIREKREEISWDDFESFGRCRNCNARVRDNFSGLSGIQKNELFKYITTSIRNEGDRRKKDTLNFLALIIGKRNREKLYDAGEKLFDIGAWPLKRLSSSGIDQRPYLNEDFVSLLSEEEAMLLFLFDYKIRREDTGYHYLDLLVNLDLPYDDLVESFKTIVKEKQVALYKELHGEDRRLNLPDFEIWHNYILAYTLKEKDVKANLLNPEWPSEKLTRKEIAVRLFPGTEDIEDKLQKLNRYIREARKLIDHANAFEGPFRVLKGKRRKLPFTEAFPFLVEIKVGRKAKRSENKPPK